MYDPKYIVRNICRSMEYGQKSDGGTSKAQEIEGKYG